MTSDPAQDSALTFDPAQDLAFPSVRFLVCGVWFVSVSNCVREVCCLVGYPGLVSKECSVLLGRVSWSGFRAFVSSEELSALPGWLSWFGFQTVECVAWSGFLVRFPSRGSIPKRSVRYAWSGEPGLVSRFRDGLWPCTFPSV